MRFERRRLEATPKDVLQGQTPWTAARPALPMAPAPVWRLVKPARGNLNSLEFEAELPAACRPNEVRVETIAAALNFRDVLSALNRYPGDPGPLGAEFVGRVVELGAEVTGLALGQRVVGIKSGAFASEILALSDVMAPVPDDLAPHLAVALPVCFLSAWRAFLELGALRPGQTVLIHCATGGVGLAAIQLARRLGVRVLATAGSAAKQDHLRSIGVSEVFNSRDESFAKEVLATTDGLGADFVLNSLRPELFVGNIRCIAPRGQLIEMGKNGLWPEEEIARLRPDVHYRKLALDDDIQSEPKTVSRLLPKILSALSSGTLAPLPVTRFPAEDAANAFRYMARAQHIGKIVLDFPAPAHADTRPAPAIAPTMATGARAEPNRAAVPVEAK